MSNDDITNLFGLSLLALFVAMILWVVFGQVTVRRLRKNVETKGQLGFEYISGGDIVNVAQTLAWPRRLARLSSKGKVSLLPDVDLLYRHTTTLDRIIARLFYWSLITAVVGAFACMFLWWLIS
ncbi:MAG: hypothetical protein P8011_02985 [Acidihalobacter sp.]|jgi:hypothetical protein|uniref:hypothetical protein n=1 Tax=Acidihalobacter sp. TaxID=1872108 RepID=UPI00307EE665